MNNIKKQFCNLESSLKLKKFRFDEECFAGYNAIGAFHKFCDTHKNSHFEGIEDACVTPLLQQTIQWLHDTEDLIIEIKWDDDLLEWQYEVFEYVIGYHLAKNSAYEDWYTCAQDAIEAALKIIEKENVTT